MASDGWPSQWAEHAQQHSPIARHAPIPVANSTKMGAGNSTVSDSSGTPSFAMHTASSRQKKDAVASSMRTPPPQFSARKGPGKAPGTGKGNGVGTSPGSKLLERAFVAQASTRRVSRTFDMSPASSSSPTTHTSPTAAAARRARRAAAAAAAFRGSGGGGSGRSCGGASSTIAVGSHVIVPIFRYHSHVATPCNGTVRFVGPTSFSGGEDVLGVELDEGGIFGNQGLHNGRRNPGEQRYFVCPDGRGVFVSAHSVRVPAGGAQNWNHSKRAHPNLLSPEPPLPPSAPDLKPLGESAVAVRWRVNGDPSTLARFEVQYRIATEIATAGPATSIAGASPPQRVGNASGTEAPPIPLLDDTEQWVHHHAPEQADSTWDWQTAVVKIEQSGKSVRRQHSYVLQRLKPDTAYDVRVRALGRVSNWGDFSAMNTCYTAGGTGPAPPVIVRARCNAVAPSAPPTMLCEWEWGERSEEDMLEGVQLQWRRRCSASQVEEETRTDEAMQAEEARAFRMMGIAASKQEHDQQTRSRALSGAAPEAMDPTGDSTWRDACGDLDVTSTSFMITNSSGDGAAPGTMRLRPGATYEIRVRGKTAAGWGRWSSSAACTLARRCVTPSSTSNTQSTQVSTDAGDEREQALIRGVLEQQTRLQLWQPREVMLTARGLLRCYRPSGFAASPASSPVVDESVLSNRPTPTPTASFTLSRVKLRAAPGTRFFSLIVGAQRVNSDETDNDETAQTHDASSPAAITKLQIIPFRATSADEATRWVEAISEAQRTLRRRQVATNQQQAHKGKTLSTKMQKDKVKNPMSPELLRAVQGRPSRQARDARRDVRRAGKAVISSVRLGKRGTKQAVIRGEHCDESVRLRGGALYSGTMEKQAKNGRWQQRYFEVKDNFLKYYADENSTALLASIDLSMATVQYVQDNLFQIHFARDKPVLLRTASQKSAMQWVKRLHGVQKSLKDCADGTVVNDNGNKCDDAGSSDQSDGDVNDERSSPVTSALDASFASKTPAEVGDHRPSLMVQGNAIFSGTLLRKSKYGQWQSRYFEVAGHYFKYFAREQSPTVLAAHDLLQTTVKYSGGSHFTLVSEGDKPVVLRAESDAAGEMWVTRLRGIQTALGVSSGAADETEAGVGASSDDTRAATSQNTSVDVSSEVTVATADSNNQISSTSKSPSTRRELQKYATSRSHDIRHVDPTALVGQRIRVFDEQNGADTGNSAGARSGKVLATRSKFGDSTRHEIMFDGAIEPEVVLLQKKANGKGFKFHVLTDSPRNGAPVENTPTLQEQCAQPNPDGLDSSSQSPVVSKGSDGIRSSIVSADAEGEPRYEPHILATGTSDSGNDDQHDYAGNNVDGVGEQISGSPEAVNETSTTLAKVRARVAQRAAQKQLKAASGQESRVQVSLPELTNGATEETFPIEKAATDTHSPAAPPSGESVAHLLPNEYEVHLEPDEIGMELQGENPAHVAWLQPSDTGGASARAGVHEGDELLAVMGVNVSNCSHDECADIIKNTSQRPLVLKLARKRHRLSSIEGSVADIDNVTSAAEDGSDTGSVVLVPVENVDVASAAEDDSDTGSVVLVPIKDSGDECAQESLSHDSIYGDADRVAESPNGKGAIGPLSSTNSTAPAPEKRVSGIGKLFSFNASSSGMQSPSREKTFSSRTDDTATPNSPVSPGSLLPQATPSPKVHVPPESPSPEQDTSVMQRLCSRDGVPLLHFASTSDFPHDVWLRIAAAGDDVTNLASEAIVLESAPLKQLRPRRSESTSSIADARPSLHQQSSIGDLAAVDETAKATRPKAQSLSEWEKERAAVLQSNEQVRASVGEENAEDAVLSHWELQRALKLKASADKHERNKRTRTLLLTLPLHELREAKPGATTTAFRAALQKHAAPANKCFSLLRENGQVACNLLALNDDDVADLIRALNSRIQKVLPRSPRASLESTSPSHASNSMEAVFSIFDAATSGNVDLLREWLEKKKTIGFPPLDVNLRAPGVIGGLKVGVNRTIRSKSITEYDQVSADSGDSLLSMATFASQDEVVKLLLRHGARWDVTNDAGMSAADVAMDYNQDYLEFPVGPIDSESSDEDADDESKSGLQRRQSVKAQRRQSNHFMRQTCQHERDIERDRAAFAKALKVGVTMKKHPSKRGKAHDRKITLSLKGDKLHVHKTSDGPGKKFLELKDIQSIVDGVDQFAKVIKLQAKKEANGQYNAGIEEIADQLNLQPELCFTIVGADDDRNFDFQAKSVEQQSVMVDGLRLLIAGRLDWNAAVATATPLLPAQNSAAPLDENAQHIHAFCALEHYWNTHMHLVEDAFNGVNARHSDQVTYDEFKKMLDILALPLCESEIETVFKAIDDDGNGMLDINEIHTGCRAMRRKLLGLADHEELPPPQALPPRPPPSKKPQ